MWDDAYSLYVTILSSWWYLFPLAAMCATIYAYLVFFRRTEHSLFRLARYVGSVLIVGILFSLAEIALRGTFDPDVLGIWLTVPFLGLCLYILSRFLPHTTQASVALREFSVVVFVVAMPIITFILWLLWVMTRSPL